MTARTTRRPSPRRARRSAAVGLVLVAAATNVAIALAPTPRATGFDAHHRAALDSARTRLAAMLTVRHADLEGDLAVASANATEPLRSTYAERLRDLVGPEWSRAQVSMTSTVSAAGIAGRPGRDTIDVEAVVTTDVTTKDEKAEQRFQVRATMQRIDDQWLVSSLTLL